MRAFEKDGTLFLVPEQNLVADQINEIRDFIKAQLEKFPDEANVSLDVKGIDVVDSLGVNLIIGLYKELTSKSKTFQIINAGDKFIKIANFFRFQSIFTIEGGNEK